jgi:hypothetical protein
LADTTRTHSKWICGCGKSSHQEKSDKGAGHGVKDVTNKRRS